MRVVVLTFALLAGCGAAPSSDDGAGHAETAATFPRTHRVENAVDLEGRPLTFDVEDGVVVASGSLGDDVVVRDLGGALVVPAFIDAHVHLSYWDVAAEHASGGIAVALDLAAPEVTLTSPPDTSPLVVLRAGPMITARGGYPLESWGHDGYGTECDDPASCAARTDTLLAEGAHVIKVPVEGVGGLDDASLTAIAQHTHTHHRLLVAHALTDRGALRAARLGADVLAHAPVETLTDETVEAWRGRAVIATLGAFGRSSAIDNLVRLRDAEVSVLYGTDLGNARTTGIDADEIALLARAGLDAAAIVRTATETPRRVLGLPRHGALGVGDAASYLVYRSDVHADPTRLARPDEVVLDGVRR
ncbi:MAG: amidohydrolase family protein [Deltaproteobacteria bacterium]|nr:amidohydrolase family protein [Deltaproteobacteria bacterium]